MKTKLLCLLMMGGMLAGDVAAHPAGRELSLCEAVGKVITGSDDLREIKGAPDHEDRGIHYFKSLITVTGVKENSVFGMSSGHATWRILVASTPDSNTALARYKEVTSMLDGCVVPMGMIQGAGIGRIHGADNSTFYQIL